MAGTGGTSGSWIPAVSMRGVCWRWCLAVDLSARCWSGTRSCHDATEPSSATGDDLVGRRIIADLAGVTRRRERESFDTCGTGSGTEDGGHRS